MDCIKYFTKDRYCPFWKWCHSCWRGLDYYKENKIKDIKKINEKEYTSKVCGTEEYNVYLNLAKPRSSTCNCALADGKKIICKHIVATYFSVVPGSGKEFEEEQKRLENEYYDYLERQYENAVDNRSLRHKKRSRSCV